MNSINPTSFISMVASWAHHYKHFCMMEWIFFSRGVSLPAPSNYRVDDTLSVHPSIPLLVRHPPRFPNDLYCGRDQSYVSVCCVSPSASASGRARSFLSPSPSLVRDRNASLSPSLSDGGGSGTWSMSTWRGVTAADLKEGYNAVITGRSGS